VTGAASEVTTLRRDTKAHIIIIIIIIIARLLCARCVFEVWHHPHPL